MISYSSNMSHIENFNTAFADEDDKEPALIINPLILYFPRTTCLLSFIVFQREVSEGNYFG